MAEATGLRNNALPYPVYGAPFGVTFPILDADGDLVTGAASLDSERSLNGDTFADCTNEATEIATSSGIYYLLLTATEMTADVVTVIVKTSTSGAKTTTLTLYPRKLVALRSGTSAGGAAGSITLDSGASTVNDAYNGCLVVGTLDSTVEARIITDYVGSTKVASVTPNWNTTPDADDTFIVYLPEGVQINQADMVVIDSAVDAGDLGAMVNDYTAGSGFNVSSMAANTLTASALADDAKSELVTAILAGTVDGITLSSVLEALLAVTTGVASVSGSTVTFKKRDGTTTKMTITYGSSDGERTGNTLS